MSLHEFIVFPAPEDFAADPAGTLKLVAEEFSKTKGCLSIYCGVSEEEKTGHIVVAWESSQAHLDSTELVGRILLDKVLGGVDRKTYLVDLVESPDVALSMPTTEVLVLKLKEGKTREDIINSVINPMIPQIILEEGCSAPFSWGETREDPRTLCTFLGWESSKRHYEVGAKPIYEAPVRNLYMSVDLKLWHTSFKKVMHQGKL